MLIFHSLAQNHLQGVWSESRASGTVQKGAQGLGCQAHCTWGQPLEVIVVFCSPSRQSCPPPQPGGTELHLAKGMGQHQRQHLWIPQLSTALTSCQLLRKFLSLSALPSPPPPSIPPPSASPLLQAEAG